MLSLLFGFAQCELVIGTGVEPHRMERVGKRVGEKRKKELRWVV